MRLVTLCVLFVAALGVMGVLVQYPYSQLKNEYDWVDRALIDKSDTIVRDKSGETTYCYIGPQAFPVSTARAKFPSYWIELFARDSLAEGVGSWTLAIASKAKRIVALRTNGTATGQRFPDAVSCGNTITLTPSGEEWMVQSGNP
jgi:hypothetical protein